MNIHIEVSCNCSAFSDKAVGSKVVHRDSFFHGLHRVLTGFQFEQAEVPGQAILVLPPEAHSSVLCGVGKRRHDPAASIYVEHRGQVQKCLRRCYAAPTVQHITVPVYTNAAYMEALSREQSFNRAEAERVTRSGATHVITAILASPEADPPPSATRIVKNLAGGNARYDRSNLTMPALINLARRTTSVSREWATVADEELAIAPPVFSAARPVLVSTDSPQSPGDLMKWLAAMKPDQVVVSLDEVLALAHTIASKCGTREGAVVS